ncbi:DegV family protein [Lacrimispora saccharolytica]|uniref:DegV family protein n=1 Tax=Lacrimispora saccharolytica (strain ATCC 35040 / DSM 2544 / NRCC 2533 / WM1) TaxID=610130 RepID=D9R277_LACSW|nr:DegV family protein [Lacrimispora saccharolytica]ADL04727.1 degV family protein [[Clostridium] saccharolyticum WM1]QRV21048.1 DegV family protein [Lacrimispora saccharolytica]
MGNFILTCCSTVDMKKEFFEQRQIPYVCFHYTMDGVTYPDDLGQSIPFPEFYDRIAKGATPVTSQVNVDEYCDFFEPFLKEGKDILHLTLSSGISGTYNSACVAREEMSSRYPDRKIVIVDTLGASAGYGLLTDAVADLRDKGAALEEAAEWTENNKLLVHHWFFSTDLTSFKRGGRISATSAMLGTVLNICPLMSIDDKGHLIPRQKIRTKKKAIQEIVHTMEAHAIDGKNYSGKCHLSYSACENDAREVAALVEERFPRLSGRVLVNSIGAVIGSHTGPGTVALFFWGDKRVD